MTETTEILKERGKRYGRFDGHADVTQRLKQVIATELHIRRKELANDQQESLDMICHKIGRIINGDANYEDSWRDIAGYAQLVADRLLEPGNENKLFVVAEDVRRDISADARKAARKMEPDMVLIPNKSNSLMAESLITKNVYVWDGDNWIMTAHPGMTISSIKLSKEKENQEECLNPKLPEPALPKGWIRPSKAYPQVAEDPSTRWQYIYDGERWLRLIKPIHEMSEKELKHLDMGGCFPYPIVFPPEPRRLLPSLPNGWEFHQRTLDSQHAAIMADDENGHPHVWMDGCWTKL